MSCLHELWGLEFSPEDIASCLERKGLLSLELELSRVCNLSCLYCYNCSGKSLDNELTLDEIFSVIDQAAGLGARKIIVLGGGEPLLYPKLFQVLEYIVQSGLQADLFTNGTLVTPEIARRFYAMRIAVSIKMNSMDATTQDYLAGKKGSFADINRGLNALLEAGYPDEDHVLGVESIICKQNYGEIPAMWRCTRKRRIIPYFEVMTLQGRALENRDLEVEQSQLRELFEELARIDKKEFGYQWLPLPPLAASRCARHEYSCTVTSVGNVHPCPGVPINTGNIRESSLQEILRTSPVF